MPSPFRSWAAVALSLFSCLSLTPAAKAQSGATDTTNIDMRAVRTWPAGPYSQVVTNYGVLQTQIPLFELKGPGGTSIGYSIYHRTNQTQQGSSYSPANGSVGAGWVQSALCSAVAGSNAQENLGANTVNDWYSTNGAGVTFSREPGTRDDFVRYANASNVTTEFDVISQADKSVRQYTQPAQDGVQSNFHLTNIVDKHGNTIHYDYDARHNPIKVTDATGQRYYTISYSADTNEQVTGVTLYYPGGSKTWSFYYTGTLLTSIEWPAPVSGGSKPRIYLAYDANTNITDLTDLNGNKWHYVYNVIWGGSTLKGVTEVHEPTTPGNWNSTNYTTFAYSTYTAGTDTSLWNLTCSITDQLYRVWKHVYYNGSGSTQYFPFPLKQTVDPTVTADSATYSDNYVWNTSDATLTQYTDKRGNPWTFTYDTNNRGLMATKKNPLNQMTQYFYDANQKLIKTIDANGDRVVNTYSPTTLDLTKTVVDPTTDPYDGSYSKPSGVALTTNYTYNTQGELASTWMGSDTATTYSNFDSYGNARTVTPPSGYATTATFDALNNKLSQTEPSPGGTTNFTYDLWNRLTQTTYPDTKFATTTYDNDNNVVSSQDANGYISTAAYDGLNRAVSSTQPVDGNSANSITVSTGYDVAGNPTTLTNGRGKTTTTTFNERHEATQIAYPDGTTRRAGYDGNGNKNRSWNGKGQLTTYSYDTANRLLTASYPDSTNVTSTWRADGVRTAMADSNGTNTWTVNGAKQLTADYQARPNKTVSYTYDSSGRKMTMHVDGETWTYHYNSAIQLQSITQSLGAPTAALYTYYNNGAVQNRTMGDNLRAWFGYDVRGRVSWISHRSVLGSVETEQEHLGYTYDNVGNALTYQNQVIGGANETTTYGYDQANRLIGETRMNGASQAYLNSYAYDKNNNRTSVTRNGVSTTYTVDNNDKLSSGEGYTLAGYDNDGNIGSLTAPGWGTSNYTFDCQNRLWQVTTPTGTVSFAYDGDNRCVERYNSAGTRYVYDGDMVIATTDSSATTTSYTLAGIGALDQNGHQYFFQENALGSTMALYDSNSGSLILSSRNEYDGYGVKRPVVIGVHSFFQFAGAHGCLFDDDSGLIVMGHRSYIPMLGRFLTQDPIGFKGGLNLYGYCKDNPVTGVDPTGLASANAGQSWNLAMGLLSDFLNGTGKSDRHYYQDSTFVKTFMTSNEWDFIKSQMEQQHYRIGSYGEVSTPGAAAYTFLVEPANGIQAQMGALSWSITSRDDKNHTVTGYIYNPLTINSLFYHIPKMLGISDKPKNSGGLSTIDEYLHFTTPIPTNSR
ncbi:hypothetical protein CCAX7_11160 [Capsulimonas corticalis]|uniref:Teneurin-like YD-shell domain-containing protein n=1 Tax=Capsulimonas corticalis TaxID=2219043 RepID=A0A402CUQ9_9BACT|nr:RHS repeat-associated core domain-containing protein [Capsulimonas corticalis]BDI29065.1 hypothetical protein CCAX7_11160 [Capsulimonas corticalis]